MPSLSERERNNVRAGVFVTVALIASLGVLVALSDVVGSFSRSTQNYTVTFDVSSGVANLKKGSDVRVGGVPMGSVMDVVPQVQEGTAFRTIGVEFKLDQRITLFSNARVVVSAPLLGNDAWLDIPNVGDSGMPIKAGETLAGTPSVGLLTTLLGPENAEKANEMVSNVTSFSEFLAGLDKEYAERYVPIIDNIGSTIDNANAVVGDLHENRWPSWAQSVSDVMTWANAATEKLDVALDHGTKMLADGSDIVAANKEPIATIVSNVDAATTRFNEQTIDKFHALMETGQQGLDSAVAVLEMMEVDYPMWSADIGDALASANLAAQQAKLTMIETRRAPWKLLYRPTANEVQHELLYDAARSFSLAVGELKTTSDAVKRILDKHGEAIKSDEDTFRRVEKAVSDSLANYENAQQRLLDVLFDDAKQ